MFRKMMTLTYLVLVAQSGLALETGDFDPESWIEVRNQLEIIESRIDWDLEGAALKADGKQQSVYAYAWKKLSKPLGSLADDELDALFEATWMVGHRVPLIGHLAGTEIDHYQILKRVFAELESRDAFRAEQVLSLQGIAIALRKFDYARDLAEMFVDAPLESIPPLKPLRASTDKGPRVWQYDPSASALVQRSIDIQELDWIIQISPGCGFAQAAMQAFADDQELSALMNDRLLWLVPPYIILDLNTQRQWNTAHPSSPMVLMHSAKEWPFLKDLPTSPVFIRMRDGEPNETVTGWPLDHSHKALLLAIAGDD